MVGGYWRLEIRKWDDLDDFTGEVVDLKPDESDLEHISKLIKDGYTDGVF